MPDTYVTPCVKICKISSVSKLCKGCGRSMLEIRNWSTYSNEQRNAIMQRDYKNIVIRVYE